MDFFRGFKLVRKVNQFRSSAIFSNAEINFATSSPVFCISATSVFGAELTMLI